MRTDDDDLKSGGRLGVLAGISALAIFMILGSTSPTHKASVATVPLASGSTPGLRLPRAADFGAATPTADARWVADWIADTRDNGTGAFILVDKRAAQLHVFDAEARWVASSAVLLGAASGDDSVPGIGSRPMALIQPGERTTPAGRFVGERGRNAAGEDVVWVDYDAAVSMHRVRLTDPSERRADRLASPTAADNRISYGCINVPAAFYDQHVQAVFSGPRAIIYVMPDVRSVREVFGRTVAGRSAGSLLLAANRDADAPPNLQVRGVRENTK